MAQNMDALVEEAFPEEEELETPKAAKLLSKNIWEMERKDLAEEWVKAAAAPPAIRVVEPIRRSPSPARSLVNQVC